MIFEALTVLTLGHTMMVGPTPEPVVRTQPIPFVVALTDDDGNEIILEEGGDGGEE